MFSVTRYATARRGGIEKPCAAPAKRKTGDDRGGPAVTVDTRPATNYTRRLPHECTARRGQQRCGPFSRLTNCVADTGFSAAVPYSVLWTVRVVSVRP